MARDLWPAMVEGELLRVVSPIPILFRFRSPLPIASPVLHSRLLHVQSQARVSRPLL